jgi:GntR family transcriptional regulator/MocR family aminotransferase
MLELAFRPDRRRAEPIYRQLADYLRELVAAGRLGAGQKLPASRELAAALGLSRNTVSQAYEALATERLVTAHVGQGTFVRAPAPARGRASSPAEPAAPRLAWAGLFARGPVPLRAPRPREADAPDFDFRGGRVDAASLPRAELKRAFAAALDGALPQLANRLEPQGWPPLREEVARALVARGVACRAEDVLIVQGAQEGLDLLARICSTRATRRPSRSRAGSARASPSRRAGRTWCRCPWTAAACAPTRWRACCAGGA